LAFGANNIGELQQYWRAGIVRGHWLFSTDDSNQKRAAWQSII
jgi:hypothetical protein